MFLAGLAALALGSPASAAGPHDAHGLWMTADQAAVIEFKPCAETATALCATIVWDVDAGKPADACGVRIARLERYDDKAWRDGWVYDPRDKKKYKAAVRVKGDELRLRAFLGAEILGETEKFTRVAALPPQPVCKPQPSPSPDRRPD
jgi:uncharacterized protein (DUF2147 family)